MHKLTLIYEEVHFIFFSSYFSFLEVRMEFVQTNP